MQYDRKKKYFTTPLFVHLEITERCGVNCPQCYAVLDKGRDMEWDYFYKIINEIISNSIPRILITGGEPLLHPRLIDMIALIRQYDIYSCISTSGQSLNSQMAKKLKIAGLNECCVSLNGSKEKIHNYSRNCFQQGIYAIKEITAHGIFCTINWVARSDNIDDFDELVNLAGKLGVGRIEIIENKENCKGILDSKLSQQQLYNLAKKVKEHRKNIEIHIENCYSDLINILHDSVPKILNGCLAGKCFFDILVDGQFSVCRHVCADKFIYNSIKEFWDDEKGMINGRLKNVKQCKYFYRKGGFMYLSKYNIIVKDFCGRFIFYNSISKNIVKARSIETENKIVKILSGLPCQNCGELINKLKEDGFILPFLYDEKILLENQIQEKIFTDKTLRLTIISTDSCNFACIYCYQTSRDTVITEEIVSELKRFLEKNIYQYNSLHIDWFGGEPLLCKDKVLNIMEYCYSLSKQKKVSLYSRITTNGFLLDPQIFRSLYKYHVLEYQITIDGIEELHNCQRPLKNGKETYGTIINNLKEISKISGHFHIIYRVNISKKSLVLKQSIMDEFMKNFGNDKRFILDIEPIRDC